MSVPPTTDCTIIDLFGYTVRCGAPDPCTDQHSTLYHAVKCGASEMREWCKTWPVGEYPPCESQNLTTTTVPEVVPLPPTGAGSLGAVALLVVVLGAVAVRAARRPGRKRRKGLPLPHRRGTGKGSGSLGSAGRKARTRRRQPSQGTT